MIVLQLFFFVNGDSLIPTNDIKISASAETPAAAPAEGFYMYYEIYTIDEITPPGNLSIEFQREETSLTKRFLMEQKESPVPGTTLHELWVLFYETEDFLFEVDIYNSNNTKSLGILMSDEIPYRNISSRYYDVPWTIDEELKQYGYKELIRHWSGIPAEYSRTITGNLLDEDGNPFAADMLINALHSTSEHSTRHGRRISTGFVNGIFSQDLDLFRTIEDEESLPFNTPFPDSFMVSFDVTFYSSNRNRFHHYEYADTASVDLGDVIMAANRIIEFNWIFKADGIFNGLEIPQTGIINTIRLADVHDHDSYQNFINSFSDPYLGSNYINTYSFSGGEDLYKDDLNAEFNYTAMGVQLLGYDDIITDLGIGTLPLAIDLSGLNPLVSNCETVETGHLYHVRTADGGWSLIEVTGIHRMTPAEMAAFDY